MALVKGTTGVDTLSGTATADIILGDKGSDTLSGLAGDDLIDGGAGNDVLNGGADNDTLLGGDGNDTLDGGTGDDFMYGGDGNDIYYVDSVNDVVEETDALSANGGVDQVRTSVTFTLGNYIENGTITSGAGLTLTGNATSNVLVNSSASGNTLDGGGAGGTDTFTGGAGNDTFILYNTGDIVNDTAGGTDTVVVRSNNSYTLSSTLENLTLEYNAGVFGSVSNTGTGNTGANVLTDNSAGYNINNVLLGGDGADTLVNNAQSGGFWVSFAYGTTTLDGGTGADAMSSTGVNRTVFVVDDAGDTVAGDSTTYYGLVDVIRSSISWDLAVNTTNVRNLVLTGSNNINGTGEGNDNSITGNSGNNTLSGLGGADSLFGEGGNDTLDGGTGADSMHGGLGNDTFIVDNVSDLVYENSGEGTDSVTSSVNFTLDSNIENLTITGAAVTAIGNSGSNILTGNTNDNTLDGGAAGGADTMYGGLGNDTYIVYNSGDQITEGSGQGTDTVIVRNNISYTLSGDLENLTLEGYAGKYESIAMTATGNIGANVITDNSTFDTGFFGDSTINNVLVGGDGVDTLVNNVSGSVGKYGLVFGADTLDGGLGADIMSSTSSNLRTVFVVDNAGDTVDGNLAGDEVRSSISWDLAVNTTDVNNLTLTGSANLNGAGNGNANSITGNSGNNTLTGLGGNDVLDGGAGNDTLDGGTGDDSMIGGFGNDTFIVDSSADVVSELAGQGTDTVIASVDYTLSGNIENLTITGTAVTAIGDSGTNVITGNANNNYIDGQGGADAMSGGLGDDTYFVDNAGDQVFEVVGQGTDTVNASASYTLSSTAEVEILNLIGGSNINGTGNALANTITGNTGNNTLDGGAGIDTLIGGLGNDTYVTDNPGDVLSENAGEGNDTVIAGYSYTVATDFENVTLSGTGDFNATGNAVANTLIGNSGNNTLDGLAGADSMEGGAGNDYFIVDNTGDVATDFGGGFDEVFASASFTLGSGIENLTLDTLVVGAINGTGNNLDNVITGTDGDNFLQGLSGNDALYAYVGNDTLDGGTGADSMFGGTGDDTYYVDNASDAVFENFGEGNDTVYASVSYTLSGSNVENLILTGAAAINGTGTNDADNITGNSGNNTLTGLGGNDTLVGGGGVDRLVGGDGDDYYVIDSTTDVVVEANTIGSGIDTVQTSVTYLLAANVENGVITAAGTLTGSAGGNTLTAEGIGANITLNGGLGADLLVNDSIGGTVTHVVDNAGDSVEGSAMGVDTVLSSVSFDMDVRGDGDVDNLTLTGSAALNGYGNAANNTINGNSGANILDGRGGDDHLNGGGGNDSYYVDSNGDVLTDTSGIETVFADGVDWTLGTGFEKLTLLGVGNNDGAGNTLANTITGNDGSNSLFGGSGNDTLIGGLGSDILEGGIGTDRLTGGGDSDTFYFAATNQGADTITDFQQGIGGDAIDISDILIGYNGNVSEFVQITQSGGNTIVKVDANGLVGGSSWVTIATLTGVNLGTDEATVLGNGNLIVT